IFGEAVNIFNVNSIFQLNALTVTTDAMGNPIGPIPTSELRKATNQVTSLDSRQLQFGFKFIF
ncbi:MAG: hypothetical protein ABIP06_06660, partial [Pyrinomonadaceae bacterium]